MTGYSPAFGRTAVGVPSLRLFAEAFRRIVIALLQAELEPEAVFRVVLGGHAGAVAGEAEHLVVDQSVAEELCALVVGERIGVEVVGQVETPHGQREPLAEELGAKPYLAQIERVLF